MTNTTIGTPREAEGAPWVLDADWSSYLRYCVALIEFRIDARRGVAPYLQIVHQVEHALRLGLLREGDQLPTVREVVAQVAVNPNTILKAYRELEHAGLVAGRPGVGTFVTRSLSDASIAAHGSLRRDLLRWVAKARRAGLGDDAVRALFEDTLWQATSTGVA
jgi:GntR family transcriptional regulator